MRYLIMVCTIVFLAVIAASAQPRPIQSSTPVVKRSPAAPPSFDAKYEGGMFGYSSKEMGTLKFDDANSRLVFYGADKKEKFSIPYDAFVVIYPQSKSVTSTTGNVVKYIPLPGAGLAGFIKEKRQYLVAQFKDPDADVEGLVNFKLDKKELLDSAIQTLGEKANMQQRGDAYYKPKVVKKVI
jgi:hypothetical protein